MDWRGAAGQGTRRSARGREVVSGERAILEDTLEYRDRVRRPELLNRIVSADAAAQLIRDGMTVGMSGFTRAGEAKAVPRALAERARRQPLQISLMTGASLGNDLDKQLTEAGVLARRMPFQVDATLRKAINAGEVMFIDQHLSDTVEQIRNLQLKKPDIAVIEAVAITEDGHIVPRRSASCSRASCRPPRWATRPASRSSPNA